MSTPKRASKSDTRTKEVPAKKTPGENDVPKENGSQKSRTSKEPKSSEKAKAPSPEPPRKTPTPNYEDDFEVRTTEVGTVRIFITFSYCLVNAFSKLDIIAI